jgi:hypothetical protein
MLGRTGDTQLIVKADRKMPDIAEIHGEWRFVLKMTLNELISSHP